MLLRDCPLIRDAAVITAVGTVMALVANDLSPRGLSLRRDYFLAESGTANPVTSLRERGGRVPGPRPLPRPGASPRDAMAPSAASAVSPTTTKRGLTMAGYEEATRWFHDPQFAAGRIVFVDARSEERYAAGHIPNAYGFDHYRPERGAAAVLAAAQAADRIVVYCNGGDCEDSELAALDLIALGVPASKLVVYGGGFSEWQQRGMPIQRQTP